MKKNIISFLRKLPEGTFKSFLRKTLLRFFEGIPQELMTNIGETVVVVGIRHIGSLEKWRNCVGPSGTVVLIEGDPRNSEILANHIKANKISNVHLLPCVAAETTGTYTFQLSDRLSDNRIKNENIDMDNDLREGYFKEVSVEATTIDAVVEKFNLKRIHFISITVNGAEFDVIKGMKDSLAITERVYSKAHAIDKTEGKPLNQLISDYLQKSGYVTTISNPSTAVAEEWGSRSGDVYAWRG